VNSIGQGAYSAAVSALPATVPGAPAWLHGQRGNGSAVLSWNAPFFNGGSAITGFLVSDGHGHTCTTTTHSCTVTGLTNGTAYTFHVVAQNAQGSSPVSNADTITPATTPVSPL
jgi:chitodextrinase